MTYSTLSSSLEVRPTSYGGRGVFARSDLLAGHVLLDVPSPIAHVVYRIFRREACAECFNYNAGETWRLPACSGGVFFCAEECQTKWETRMGDSGMRAWSDVEQWMKKAGARTSKHEKETRSEEETPVTQEDVEHAWMEAQKAADALDGLAGPKARNRVIQSMQGHPAHPDVIALLLSGIITFFNGLEGLEELRMLAPTSTPYKSGVMLQEHINSYLALRHLLPPEMKSVVTVDAVQQIAIRDAHNSFGMWSQPEDEGAEMLGFGGYMNTPTLIDTDQLPKGYGPQPRSSIIHVIRPS
jgi:hypothetical protein